MGRAGYLVCRGRTRPPTSIPLRLPLHSSWLVVDSGQCRGGTRTERAGAGAAVFRFKTSERALRKVLPLSRASLDCCPCASVALFCALGQSFGCVLCNGDRRILARRPLGTSVFITMFDAGVGGGLCVDASARRRAHQASNGREVCGRRGSDGVHSNPTARAPCECAE